MIEKGYYYHYKHDPEKGIFDAAYEVVGCAFDTEAGGNVHTDNPEAFMDTEMVIYRPLFEDALVYKAEKRFWLRPSKMWFEFIELNGQRTTRFVKIVDEETIARFDEKRRQMYGE